MSTEDTNRVGSAEFSAEEVRRKLVEIAEAVIGRPMAAAEMIRLTGDDEVPSDSWAHEPGTVVVHGFGFEDGGYSFTIQRVSETEHSDNPIAATKVYGPKRR